MLYSPVSSGRKKTTPLSAHRILARGFLGNVFGLQINGGYVAGRENGRLSAEYLSRGEFQLEARLPVTRSEGRRGNRVAIVAQELRPRNKVDLRFRKFRLESLQYGNCVRRNSVVVSQQIFGLIRERSNQCDFERSRLQRKRAVILKQHHRFVGERARHRAMLRSIEFFFVNRRVRNHLRRIEHAQLHSRREQPNQRSVNLAFFQDSLLICVEVRLVVVIVLYLCEVNALVIHAALHGQGRGFRLGLGEVMIPENVDDRVAIRNYIALKSPLAAQLILQQELVHASRLPVDAVVGAHHRAGLSLRHRRPERRQIGIYFVVLADFHVGRVAGRLGAAVYGVVLGSRNDTIVFWIVALHAGNKRHAHARRQKWIFAVSFLTASPSRITKDVDVRRPEVQPFEDVAMPIAHALERNWPALQCRSRSPCGGSHRYQTLRPGRPVPETQWFRSGPRHAAASLHQS